MLAVLQRDPFYKKVYQALNTTGGLKIYTTMDPQDQTAAQNAVDWVAPPNDPAFNPEHIADTEVLIKPGTGQVKAIAVDRVYGIGGGQTNIDYAVNGPEDGGVGVQTGSSSKLFTLVTALEQGIPFGFTQTVTSPASIGGYTNCKGQPDSLFQVSNAEGASPKPEVFTLYNGTTQSINVFFAMLEQKVGLCNVVKTAVNMGVTRADGASLLAPSAGQLPADDIPSFTLGAVNVSPMSMASAYATVAANGVYCKPIAIQSIVTTGGHQEPVEAPGCHQAIPAAVADAANYILQGVLTSGTAAGRGIGRPAAGKTGTANGGFYAAFGGYTPTLAGYVSVFNPAHPTTSGKMVGNPGSCYRENPQTGGGEECPGQMFGDNAPAATWQMTFTHANLGAPLGFAPVPPGTPYFSQGTGVNSPAPPKKPKGGNGGPGGGNGGPGGGNGGPGGHNPPPPLLNPAVLPGPADIVAGVR